MYESIINYQYLFIILSLCFNLIIYLNFNKLENFINIYDEIDSSRKIHKKRTSLLGGVIIFLNILFYLIFIIIDNKNSSDLLFDNLNIIIFINLGFIFCIGILDDKYNINANIRLLITGAIILFLILSFEELQIKNVRLSFISAQLELGSFSILLTLFCILIFINAFNMYDGINLQNGIYSIIIFIFFILNNIEVIFSILMLITLINFLILNYKNKTFMGDSGTMLLASLISIIFINNYSLKNIIYADEIFLVMLMPGLEIIRLFILRLLNNKHPFKADNNHIHHYLHSKVSNIVANIILLIMTSVPIILSIYFNNLIAILIGLISYIIIIYHFTKKTIKENNA